MPSLSSHFSTRCELVLNMGIFYIGYRTIKCTTARSYNSRTAVASTVLRPSHEVQPISPLKHSATPLPSTHSKPQIQPWLQLRTALVGTESKWLYRAPSRIFNLACENTLARSTNSSRHRGSNVGNEVEADISASRNARSRMKVQIHHSRRLYLWE